MTPTDGALFAGIESTFTFNGLTLNNKTGDDRYRITQINGLHSADIRDSRENLTSRDGEIASNSYYGGRTITLQGRIESRHNRIHGLRLMQYEMVKAFSPLRESTLFIDCGALGGWDTQINCRQSQPLQMSEEVKSFQHFRDFMITLRASDPRIVSQEIQTSNYTASGTSVSATISTLNNMGNYYASPVITLVGPLTNPTVTIGGDIISFKPSTTIATGNSIIIDTDKGTVVDQTGINKYSLLDINTRLPVLSPGLNPIIFIASGMTAGTSQLNIEYRHSWL